MSENISPVGLKVSSEEIGSKVVEAALPSPWVQPNPEVKVSTARRSFTASYKLKILDELDRCVANGEKGAVIRREGLYSSCISDWRRQRDEGALSALNKARGRQSRYDAHTQTVARLEKEIAALRGKLSQAELIIDVQKKVSEIFGVNSPLSDSHEKTS